MAMGIFFFRFVSSQSSGKVVKVPALFLLFFPTLFLLATAHATNCFNLGLLLFSLQVAWDNLKYISFLSSLSQEENLCFPLCCVSQIFFHCDKCQRKPTEGKRDLFWFMGSEVLARCDREGMLEQSCSHHGNHEADVNACPGRFSFLTPFLSGA